MKATADEASSEQRAVIDSAEPSIVVVASAGAGKTSTLVRRYLKHVIVDGFRPDEILTITFTRKAAAEMKRRIVSALRDRNLLAEAQIAETGPIQTIHGFCERMLRENSLEAGLDPQFEILAEGQARRLLDDAIRKSLAGGIDQDPYVASLLHDVAGRFSNSPNGEIGEAVKKALESARPSGAPRGRVAQIYADPKSTLTHLHRELASAYFTPPQVDLISASLGTDEFSAILRDLAKSKGSKKAFLNSASDWLFEWRLAEQTTGLMRLVSRAWELYESKLQEIQSLDFVALEARAVELLRASEATRLRLRRQYKVAMVDEAQDMNAMQHILVDSLGIAREMLVGDPQQSIYGFREADVRLFEVRAASASQLRLSKNYRSTPGILSFVDRVFGAVWADRYTPMSPPPVAIDLDADVVDTDNPSVEIWHQSKDDYSATAMFLRELISEGEAPRDIALLTRNNKTAETLATLLEDAGIASRIVGGATRFYTRLHVRDLANCLKAIVDPYDDFALLAVLRSPLGGLSLDSIAVLAKSRPVFESLKDFDPPIEADRERIQRFLAWFSPLSDHADRLAAWEALSEVFAQSNYLPALARRRDADQQLANVRKLLGQAIASPELGPSDFAEHIREIQRLRHPAGEAPAIDEATDAVTIMTIHKAKGLEFPVVVIPETHIPVRAQDRGPFADPRRLAVVTKFDVHKSRFSEWLKDEQLTRDTDEQERLLYVAMTRAARRLCLCVDVRAPERSMAGILVKTLDMKRADPAGVRVRRKSE